MEGRGAKGLRALIARLEDPDLLPPPGDDDGVPGIWAWCRGKPEEDGIFGRGWEVEEEEEDGRAPPFFHSKKAKVPGRNETIHQTKPNHHASISKGGKKKTKQQSRRPHQTKKLEWMPKAMSGEALAYRPSFAMSIVGAAAASWGEGMRCDGGGGTGTDERGQEPAAAAPEPCLFGGAKRTEVPPSRSAQTPVEDRGSYEN